MEINKDILKKAEEKIAECEYIDTCHKARICPKCGSNIILRPKDLDSILRPKKRFWRIDSNQDWIFECDGCDYKQMIRM